MPSWQLLWPDQPTTHRGSGHHSRPVDPTDSAAGGRRWSLLFPVWKRREPFLGRSRARLERWDRRLGWCGLWPLELWPFELGRLRLPTWARPERLASPQVGERGGGGLGVLLAVERGSRHRAISAGSVREWRRLREKFWHCRSYRRRKVLAGRPGAELPDYRAPPWGGRPRCAQPTDCRSVGLLLGARPTGLCCLPRACPALLGRELLRARRAALGAPTSERLKPGWWRLGTGFLAAWHIPDSSRMRRPHAIGLTTLCVGATLIRTGYA
jgi:hypothetical protein